MNVPTIANQLDALYFNNGYDRLTIKSTDQTIYRFTPNKLFEKFSEYKINEAHKDLPRYIYEWSLLDSYDYDTDPEVSYDFYIDNDDWYIRSLMNPAQNGAVVMPYTENHMQIVLRYFPNKDKIEIRVAPDGTQLVPMLIDNLISDSNNKGWYIIKLDPIEENRIKEALKATQTYVECDADYKEECMDTPRTM